MRSVHLILLKIHTHPNGLHRRKSGRIRRTSFNGQDSAVGIANYLYFLFQANIMPSKSSLDARRSPMERKKERKACKERRRSKKETPPCTRKIRVLREVAGGSWSTLLRALKPSMPRQRRHVRVCWDPEPRVHARKIAIAQEAGRSPDWVTI